MADPNWLEKTTYWQLEIGFWLSAVEAGVRPVRAHNYNPDPAQYQPRTIDFKHPPSREDFLQVVRQTPWMHVWEESLLPIIAQHDWPMIDFAHKAASVELKTAEGVPVGRLDVRKQESFYNKPYVTLMVTVAEIDRVVNQLPKERRGDARLLLSEREHRIQEQLSKLGWTPTGDDLERGIRAVLVEGEFLKERESVYAKKVSVP